MGKEDTPTRTQDGPLGRTPSQDASHEPKTNQQHPEKRNRYSCVPSPAQELRAASLPPGSLLGSPRLG